LVIIISTYYSYSIVRRGILILSELIWILIGWTHNNKLIIVLISDIMLNKLTVAFIDIERKVMGGPN
jgi:hypothetical protein